LALRCVILPPVLLGIVGLGVIGALLERRCETTPNAILGFFIGLTSVMLTLVLNAFALIVGGAESWGSIVLLVFLAHLPIVVLEGIIMGFTVSFLNRVKPDLLVGWEPPPERAAPLADSVAPDRPLHAGSQAFTGPSAVQERPLPGSSLRYPALLLALTGMLLMATPVWAHRLEVEYKILKDGRIQIESWFETGDSPPNAKVQVFLPGDQLLIDGKLDKDGTFVFKADGTLPLRVVVNAGAGHRKELTIPKTLNGGQESNPEPSSSDGIVRSERTHEFPYKDVLVGIGFLLATAAFALSLRNARVLREIQQSLRSEAQRDS
jgi:Cobalt uptake substrate-specific transmembrane region